jgi:hypothetical protein
MMNSLNIKALMLSIGLALSAGALAGSMSNDQHDFKEKNIDTDYKVAKEVCGSLTGNANDICGAEAKGKMDIAKAELEHNFKPTGKTLYNMRITNAEAEYSVAIQKCDDKDGNVESVCEKEAKAAKIQQTAAAEAQMKTSKADAVAIEKSSAARKDAETDMRDANYAVAKQKCGALASDAEDLCINDAKIHFGM